MKKGRFLWSAHRITEKQKAGKARNIKGKRQLKNFSTALKQHVGHRSFQRDKELFICNMKPLKICSFQGFYNIFVDFYDIIAYNKSR